MKFRDFGKTGLKVSALGLGCMRFPNGSDGKTDEDNAVKMIRAAIDSGIAYMDTAWPYHDGRSEVMLGRALKDGYREKVTVATKCPMGQMNSAEDFDRVLDEQLARLQLDSVDLYMFHGIDRGHFDNKIVKFGLLDKMEQARAAGKIKYIGFSFHDSYDAFLHILNGYDWDFCQIQMNYVDIGYQATIEGLEEVGRRGMGLIIMEPLLGGKLADLPKKAAEVIDGSKSPVEWALDFLWNRPEVGVVLSGMSSMQQIEDNIKYAERSSIGMLQQRDIDMLMEVREAYNSVLLAPCTRCRYCMPCPAGIDIPRALKAYNTTATATYDEAKSYYDRQVEVGASDCLHCEQCEGECPQHLPVSKLMYKIAEVFAR